MVLKIISKLTVDRYYKMSDYQLEQEAQKWNIREYGNINGLPSRNIIISQLIQKDETNNSRIALYISILAILISITIPLIGFFF